MIEYYSHCSTPCFLIISKVLSSRRQRKLIYVNIQNIKNMRDKDEIKKNIKYITL